MSQIWEQYPIPFLGPRGAPYKRYKNALRRDPCVLCGEYFFCKRLTTIDHIVPSSKGGVNTFHNLAGACSLCNQRKADESLLLFLLDGLNRD